MPKKEFKVCIGTIDRVRTFVKICDTFDSDIDLSAGRYVVDAKSIMGIFSFDITRDLVVTIHSDNNDELYRFNDEMKEFMIEN